MKDSMPEKIDLTKEQAVQLLERLNSSNLSPEDQKLVAGVLNFCLWLQLKLTQATISIRKLTKIFGITSEKRSNSTQQQQEDESNREQQTASNTETQNNGNSAKNDSNSKKKGKNKGRNPASKYSGAEEIYIKHSTLSVGDLCPMELCTGRLYKFEPGNVIRIIGGKIAEAKHYIIEKLKCNLCNKLFTAQLPEIAGETKYDARFKANLLVYKYFLGLPFHRIETMQNYLGIPLPDSTQWYLIDQITDDVYPIFSYMEYAAAQGIAVFCDDTSAKILAIINRNKKDPNVARTGTFTSGIISQVGEHKIYLFYSGTKHAGENIANLLKKRHKELDDILYMCDALSGNVAYISEDFKVIIINCLVHGRRNFIDIEPNFPEECGFVIKSFFLIYKHEKETKTQQLSNTQRLEYHQKHSAPVMEQLNKWCKEQLTITEPNNGLGKAIKYMLKYWDKLTRFLHIPGAALDNNCCEQILKIPIRVRKSSNFFATEHGAFVGGDCAARLRDNVAHPCTTKALACAAP